MFLGGDHRDRDSATAYSKSSLPARTPTSQILIRRSGQTICRPGFPSHSLSPSLSLCPSLAGMSVEMVAMLLASVIQGQVVAVYNTEKQEACQHLDHETPQSTSLPNTASLPETVNTALKVLKKKSRHSSWETLTFQSSSIALALYPHGPRDILLPCNLVFLAQHLSSALLCVHLCMCVCVCSQILLLLHNYSVAGTD